MTTYNNLYKLTPETVAQLSTFSRTILGICTDALQPYTYLDGGSALNICLRNSADAGMTYVDKWQDLAIAHWDPLPWYRIFPTTVNGKFELRIPVFQDAQRSVASWEQEILRQIAKAGLYTTGICATKLNAPKVITAHVIDGADVTECDVYKVPPVSNCVYVLVSFEIALDTLLSLDGESVMRI